MFVRFEWDVAKATVNQTKHGVSFELAKRVWDDPLNMLISDRIVEGQVRWHMVGLAGPILLVVVHTYPDPGDDDWVRIVSARRATAHERRRYERGDH
jgi:uncharacterized DUF497 family protein